MSETVIRTEGLSKRYGAFEAVRELNLGIGRAEVFGLLGPNGAGKTTTILMLLGLTEPSAGSVRVLGFDPLREPLEVKRRVGYLPDSVGFYDDLSAESNLLYTARLAGLETETARRRIGEALAKMSLAAVARRKVGTFSRGMRQRLGLAEILLKEPRVVILDEPTTGLDPEAAQEFLQLIRRLKEEGITVLLSSHLLHQVQAVCDRVGLFHRGRMVLEGTVRDLANRILGGSFRLRLEAEKRDRCGGAALIEGLRAIPEVTAVEALDECRYQIEARRDVRPEVADRVIAAGGRLLGLSREDPGLDEVYTRYFEEARHEVDPVPAAKGVGLQA